MDKNLFKLLRNYLRGTLTYNDRKTINDWYEGLDRAAARFPSRFVQNRVKQELWVHIASHTAGTTGRSRLIISRRRAIAAAVLLLTASAAIFGIYTQRDRLFAPGIAYQTLHVPVGKTQKVTLADHSELWLNSGTVIRYPAQFTDTEREVTLLSGEAFFQVAADQHRPFRVRSGKMTTTVLGTSFNLRVLKNSGLFQAKVMSGKISVAADGRSLATLSPQQGLNANLYSGWGAHPFTHLEKLPAWMTGSIQLESASFAELTDVMELYYGVHLHSDDPRVLQSRYTAGFERKDSLQTVLEIISAINRMDFQIKGDQVIIQ